MAPRPPGGGKPHRHHFKNWYFLVNSLRRVERDCSNCSCSTHLEHPHGGGWCDRRGNPNRKRPRRGGRRSVGASKQGPRVHGPDVHVLSWVRRCGGLRSFEGERGGDAGSGAQVLRCLGQAALKQPWDTSCCLRERRPSRCSFLVESTHRRHRACFLMTQPRSGCWYRQ